jgi:cation diffusion facilitator CzcD-associated flavoprotein CzcO
MYRIEGGVVKKVERKAEWVTKNKEWPVRVRDGEESTWALGLVSGKSSSS